MWGSNALRSSSSYPRYHTGGDCSHKEVGFWLAFPNIKGKGNGVHLKRRTLSSDSEVRGRRGPGMPQLPLPISQMGWRKQQAFSSVVLESGVWYWVPSWLLWGLACRCLPCHCVLEWQREERAHEFSCSQPEGLFSAPCTTRIAYHRLLCVCTHTEASGFNICNMGRHTDKERNLSSGGMKKIKRNQRGACKMRCNWI